MSEDGGHVENTITGGLFFHTVIQGRDVTVHLPPQITPALSGLPAPSPTFVGRADHLEMLLEHLTPSKHQESFLVSALAGLAGIGKTELAVHAAKEALQRNWFPGGVLYINLFGYDAVRRLSAERALESLLRALAVPAEHIPESLEDRQRLYRSVLTHYAHEGRRILVVVDNVSTVEHARPLLPTDCVTAALVTSRHTLDGLDARLLDLSPLEEATSVELLDQALRHARGDLDTRFTNDATAASEIARLCGGLPLALRIAAALLAAAPSRPASSLADALQAEHSRLDKLQRPDRAVRAAFDLSYVVLDTDHARLFRLLSLQPGPDLSTDSASHLANIDAEKTEEMLQHLADAHLIDVGQVWGRWRIHDLVRIYAREKIETQEEREEALARLLDHYLIFCRDASAALIRSQFDGVFSTRDATLSWLDIERENLIASVFMAANEGHPSYAAEMPHRLAKYLDIRRLFNDWEALMRISHSILDGSGYIAFEAGALDSLGMASRMLHKLPEAVEYHRQAITLARGSGHDDLLCRYLNNMGTALMEMRSFDEAFAAHDEAASIFFRLGDRLGYARASDNGASVLRNLGNPARALQYHERAIAQFSEGSALESKARALTHMGSTPHALEKYPQAVAAHRESMRILKMLGLFNEAAHTLNNLANSLREAGELEEALAVIGESVDFFRLTEDEFGGARALNQAALIHIARQEYELATENLEESLMFFRDFGESIDSAYVYANLGLVFSLTGNPVRAIAALQVARKSFISLNAPADAMQAQYLIDSMYALMVEMNERHPIKNAQSMGDV